MPEFISKLQYKTCEKGEYSDEKARNLEETLLLIKTFPWNEQRDTDVQLTGPSVTIVDEYGNYLKAALYFNGKFCLYYLDCDNHLYEYHVPEIEGVNGVVKDFFNGQIDLTKFEKHLLNIGNKAHFLSKDFTYRVELVNVIFLSFSFITLFLMFTIASIAFVLSKAPFLASGISLLFSLLFVALLIYIFKRYSACSDQILEVSKGNDIFSFESNGYETTYNKKDIQQIIHYSPGGGKNPNMFHVFEIQFNDSTTIKFSNMLISDTILVYKFASILFVPGKKSSLWLI